MTTQRRLLVIGLDGLEISYAEKLMDEGKLPALDALRKRSATFQLEHGPAQRTGLAWEHVASGLSPEDGKRWSAVEFNPKTYEVWQEGARFTPFFESLNVRTVVFDPPYFDLKKTAKVSGIVGWGAHDPGTALVANPPSLKQELEENFGSYPSKKWIYACPCHSAKRCQQMGEALVEAVEVRGRAAKWLLSKKFPDWELFFVVTGELHSAIEGLWHGVDPQHPLHKHPSAPAAAEALLKIHQAVDRMVAELVEAAGDVDVVAFAMGGMGSNQSDIQSMILLPELLYRDTFKRSLLKVPPSWSDAPERVPQLTAAQNWHVSGADWSSRGIANGKQSHSFVDTLRKLKRELPLPVRRVVEQMRNTGAQQHPAQPPSSKESNERPQAPTSAFHLFLTWHPAIAYQSYWPQMPAFGFPSFYDGKVRLNLIGRESQGIVPLSEYEETCSRIEQTIRQCRDARTGEPVVAEVERPKIQDPLSLDSSDADLTIVWRGMSNAFIHPEYGAIGPIPFRRTGGHTGPDGVAFVASPDFQPGFQGVRSSFDVVPTIAELLGEKITVPCSGESLLQKCSSELA
ncbi:MAG: alkaline phosphatase family protein [Cyanobacteriota bacterium]|nr:alkaline phosphatase family protein [Cyanobacteriota bacterium]